MDDKPLTVRALLLKQPENAIIEAADFCQKAGKPVSEFSFYKTLERMTKSGELMHLARGMYYRPGKSRFGTVPISEEEIISHFTKNNKGLIIGYRLYVRIGLTTQIGRRTEILSSAIKGETKNINNIFISRINMKLFPAVKGTVEVLEVLQNCRYIEDLNSSAFAGYIKNFSKAYSDEIADYVLARRKYKKSTTAFLKRCLDILGIPCGLGKYLSPLSDYKIPDDKEITAVFRLNG